MVALQDGRLRTMHNTGIFLTLTVGDFMDIQFKSLLIWHREDGVMDIDGEAIVNGGAYKVKNITLPDNLMVALVAAVQSEAANRLGVSDGN